MRIVLDLQGAQSESRLRGIGRYSLSLALEITRHAQNHEVWLALNAQLPEAIESIRAEFADLIPNDRIRVFDFPGPIAEADASNWKRMEVAEMLREKFLADLRPDIVHISSLFEGYTNEVVASIGKFNPAIPTAVTLYDLIPMELPDLYLTDEGRRQHYLRHAQSLKRADLLLAISEFTAKTANDLLNIADEKLTVIGGGVDTFFQPTNSIAKNQNTPVINRMIDLGINLPYLLYTGGGEPRKNLVNLINAFGLLTIRSNLQMVVLGKVESADRENAIRSLKRLGLSEQTIVFLNYISQEDLLLLYHHCELYVFPSLSEGFGLPALEAMACGAPVIASNCSSIPEIVNRGEILFDPKNPEDISAHIATVLSNPELRNDLRAWGLERAKFFSWKNCAIKALQAFERLHQSKKEAEKFAITSQQVSGNIDITVHSTKPTLAFVSPLPPEQSGIANYAADLLPYLARHYDITCIVDQAEVLHPWIASEFSIRDVNWFKRYAGKLDRVLYQIGNSPVHKHMFELLPHYPGVIMLHDLYLSSALRWMDTQNYEPGCLTRALYNSHGYAAISEYHDVDVESITKRFPCSRSIFEFGIGVLLHSNYAKNEAEKWYGAAPHRTEVIPFSPHPPEFISRQDARKRLGIPEQMFLVGSFGALAPVKKNIHLIEAWGRSELSKDPLAQLTFVGGVDGASYRRTLEEKINSTSKGSKIHITDYASPALYRDYLAAVDVAVQLRTDSRGETSGAIFDCLASDTPLIINAHGSFAELPDDIAIKIEDDFAIETLTNALETLRDNEQLRIRLKSKAKEYIHHTHRPEQVAHRYFRATEKFYNQSPTAHEANLVQRIAQRNANSRAPLDLAATATSIAANRPRFGIRNLFLDITRITTNAQGTGIEQMAYAITMALIEEPPPGYRVEPVRALDNGYVYARKFLTTALKFLSVPAEDSPLELYPGDLFLGLDGNNHMAPKMKDWFWKQRNRGIYLAFVINDLLPLPKSDLAPKGATADTAQWLETLIELADQLVCNSKTTETKVTGWISRCNLSRLRPIKLNHLGLGTGSLHLPSEKIPESSKPIWQQTAKDLIDAVINPDRSEA
jgi:glycosyltransferase involved in cell wall biosynthesis